MQFTQRHNISWNIFGYYKWYRVIGEKHILNVSILRLLKKAVNEPRVWDVFLCRGKVVQYRYTQDWK